jgi:hypothetical protein
VARVALGGDGGDGGDGDGGGGDLHGDLQWVATGSAVRALAAVQPPAAAVGDAALHAPPPPLTATLTRGHAFREQGDTAPTRTISDNVGLFRVRFYVADLRARLHLVRQRP